MIAPSGSGGSTILSVTDGRRDSGGDRNQHAPRLPESVVNIAHIPKELTDDLSMQTAPPKPRPIISRNARLRRIVFDMCDLGADDPARPRRGTPIIASE